MKVAIPIWEDRVSPVLDTASRLLVIDVENRKEASRSETYLEGLDLFRKCFRIQNLGVDILICGAISRPYFRELAATGIHVISGISGNPENVLKAYLKGTLSHSRFAMPGCRGNGFRRRMMRSPLEKLKDKRIKVGGELTTNKNLEEEV
jgi:predicted Fe-Mo cluster-binding NifX family protein